ERQTADAWHTRSPVAGRAHSHRAAFAVRCYLAATGTPTGAGCTARCAAARIGLTTNSAVIPTATFAIAATVNTACQLPVLACRRLATGTRNDAVPFAV